ncbi:MAG: sigma-70 family RNA polymerase sigma factor [Acidobacteriia bacterium]|nr:sigma-70 family RNA polymerase sigma factor [Terriglobia bacterium]
MPQPEAPQPEAPQLEAASPADETTLVHQAKAGDLAAFSELVTRYEGKVFRLTRHILNSREDAEDVTQEAFLKAFTHLDGFQENSRFYTWVVRIAVNESLMRLRKSGRRPMVSLDEPVDTGEDEMVRELAVWDETPEQKYSQEELRAILDQAVDSLGPIYRAVFLLRDVDELSTEETANALDLSIPAVKSRLLRARLQLREILTQHFKRKGDDILAYL